MTVPSAAQLLTLWERGVERHPIDRALLIAGWAAPELSPDALADLPLGAVNRALLRLRETWFGGMIRAYLDCERCGERLELSLATGLLAPPASGSGELELCGYRFRLPCARDLAAIAEADNLEAAALELIARCCVRRPAATSPGDLAEHLSEVEEGLEALDPAADISLALACDACGYHWAAPFDIGALLWDEVEAAACALIAEIHALARSYGWSEPEILALSARRRAAYLAMVGA
jgi:hypothetical protein